MKQFCFLAFCGLSSVSFGQELKAVEFEASPSFTENFAGGAAVGQWELDPALPALSVTNVSVPTFVTSTPSGVDPVVTALNPVASSEDGGVMYQGSPASTSGSNFGLNYFRCLNSLANGSGESFETLDKYRVVARHYLFTPAQKPQRWQVGPYAFFNASNLFRPASFYNTNATGGGPGFGTRGSTSGTVVIPGTAVIATSGWTEMSVMVDATDAEPANHRVSYCVDANRDGTLDENDPLEYISLTLNSSLYTPGPFGVFTVGEVYSDGFPLFTDWVKLYKPSLAKVEDWTLY